MTPVLDLTFPRDWSAEILAHRPLILPPRHFTYPREAEEVERGALEVMVRCNSGEAFLATCALGFADPSAPSGMWSCPSPQELCAVAGGYAYVVDTSDPQRFTHLPLRPVLEVRALPEAGLLLFSGHHSLLAWGAQGLAWQTQRLSWEGITITNIAGDALQGVGWDLMTDREVPFIVDLKSGKHTGGLS